MTWTHRSILGIGYNEVRITFVRGLQYVCVFLLMQTSVQGQQITVLQQGHPNDSSYYHLTKIEDNEYWACGEGGIITRFDTLGHFESLPIPTEGYNILKVERFGDNVFIATDNARLMKYHVKTGVLKKVDFRNYRNRCFYDFQCLPDGRIILCGGTTGISMGIKKIPHGFIAMTDTSFSPPKKLWKSYRKFVWSLWKEEDGTMIASVFNGINSKLLSTHDLQHWKKNQKVKGLIHEIKFREEDHQLTYVGTSNIHYGKTGMYNLRGEHHVVVDTSGCIWSQEISKEFQVMCGQKGQLFLFQASQPSQEISAMPGFALYDLKFVTSSTLLVVGHGKCACLVKLK